MRWKRFLAAAGLIGAATATTGILAQEQPKPAETPPSKDATVKEEPAALPPQQGKPGFWGEHFALYLEVAAGSASSEPVETSISTLSSAVTQSTLALDDMAGVLAVGWKLPADRGSFLLSFTGLTETGYTAESTAYRRSVVIASSGNPISATDFYPWWSVVIRDGLDTSTRTPAVWEDAAPINSRIDPGEVTQDPDLVVQTSIPDNAQNRLQTWDALYARGFGGRVWSGRWTAGLRHLVYQGNVPTTAWLSTAPTFPGDHFTDGASLPLLVFNQDTSGSGPTGSLAVEYHLFKGRLTLYGESRFAFLLQDLNCDSGDFYTLVRTTSGGLDIVATSPARLQNSVTKSSWNFGGEVGARFRVADGFGVNLAFNRTAYQDTVLLPYSITIPANPAEIPQGTVGLYQTKDLQFDSVRLGLTFQF